jgi:small-conductance mechanosensitive channel
MEQASGAAAKALERALAERAELRSPKVLLRAALMAALGTLAFILAVMAIRLGSRRLLSVLTRVEERAVGRLALRGFSPLERALLALHGVVRLSRWALLALATYLWLVFVLTRFPYTRAWGEQLGERAAGFLHACARAVVANIPNVLIVIIVVVATRFLVRIVRAFFEAVREGKVAAGLFDSETARPTANIISVLLWMLALIMAYPYLPGSSSEAFKGVSIFAGIVVSLGSANVFAQVTAGLTLMYSRAFRHGDFIKVGDIEGTVVSVGYLSTKIRTGRQEEVNIPNTVILGTSVKNYSRTGAGKVLFHTSVTIGYSAPWRAVHKLLLDAARQTKGVAAEPPPRVFQVELSDFYVVYELLSFLEAEAPRRPTLSALHENIQDSFNRAGIQIMSPHYEGDPAGKVWVPPDQWEMRMPKRDLPPRPDDQQTEE